MTINNEKDSIQEAFEIEADEIGFCLDQKWGDYENPYENNDTALAFDLFKKGWQAKQQVLTDNFVMVPKELPSETNDRIWDDYLTPKCVVNEDGFSFISCEDFDLDALYQMLLKAQEQSHE